MADEEKNLQVTLSYGVDQSSLQQSVTQGNQVTSMLANQEQQLRRNRTELRELGQVFTAIGLAGAAIYVPAIAASQAYLKSAGQNEALSRQWLADTDKIKQSTIDIGRVVTEGLLPGYTTIADISAKVSAFAQENPGVIQAAVTIGGALVAIGAGGKIFVEVSRAVTDIQLIVSGGMMNAARIQAGAATTMLAAANIQAGGDVAAVGGDVAVGVGGTAGLAGLAAAGTAAIIPIATVAAGVVVLANAAKQVDEHSQAFANIDNFINGLIDPTHPKVGPNTSSTTTGANNSGALPNVENTEAIDYWAKQNQPEPTGPNAQAPYTIDQINTQGLADYKSEQDAIAAAQKTYDTDSIAENKRYYDTQAQELSAHNLTDLQDEQDFQTQKAQKILDFNQSELDQLQTYQNSMADLSQSHQDRLRELTKNHDVLGIESENTSYSEQKAQKERDFNEADQARRTAFAQQQSDEQKNYDLSKKRRDDAFDLQQKQEADQHTAAMQTLKQNLADQTTLEKTSFQNQMNALLGIADTTEIALEQGFKLFMASVGFGTAPTAWDWGDNTKDSGGYFLPGVARNASGRAEFVAAPDTVKYAESIVGGRLTQQNLIAAMISGRSGGASSSIYQDSRSVNVSGLTAQDRLVVRDLVNRGVSDWAKAEFGR